MNERTHFFIKNIYLSHFILEMVNASVVCERRMETGTDCYIGPTFSPGHSSTSSASWLGLLNQGLLRATALSLQAGPHSGLPGPTNSTAAGTSLYSFITLTCFRFFFRLFTSLIDGSVKGQYTTQCLVIIHQMDSNTYTQRCWPTSKNLYS